MLQKNLTLTYIFIIAIFFQGVTQTFQDNASNETMGEFPSKWDVVTGMAVVDQVDGYPIISILHGGKINPIVNGLDDNYLGSDFTLEFDAFFDRASSLYGQRFEVRLWSGTSDYHKDGISYSPFIIYRNGLKTTWNNGQPGSSNTVKKELETLNAVWRHVKVESSEGKLKIYLDDHLLLQFPRFKMQPTMISIGAGINESGFNDTKLGITNVTIITPPKETKIVMFVDNNTNIVKDINLYENFEKLPSLKNNYPNTTAYFGTIYGNYAVRLIEFSDVKKLQIGSVSPSNTMDARASHEANLYDLEKRKFIDLNAFGFFTVQPEQDAKLVLDLENGSDSQALSFTGNKNYSPNLIGKTLSGDYFRTNSTLSTTTKNLTLKDTKLYLLPKGTEPLTEIPTIIGETEKNDTGTTTYPNINTNIPILGNTNPNLNESIISSSSNEIDDTCGALPSVEQYQILSDPNSPYNERLKFLENYTIEDLRGVPTVQKVNGQFVLPQKLMFSTSSTENYSVIPIAAHILRKSNHEEGLSLRELYASVNRANALFDKYGVYLNIETIKFIDNDELYNINYDYTDNNKDGIYDEVTNLNITDRNISNKLNIYFVQNSSTSWANFPDTSVNEQHILMNNEHAKNESTLTHEIGHWFNLLHTHDTQFNVDLGFGLCSLTGDLCCDTPPDPKLSNKVNDDCEYKNKSDSKLSGLLDPDPKNLMSYSLKKCRENFSDEQVKRMLNAYLGMEEDRGYTFKVNKDIGENLGQFNIESGWDFIEHFEIGGSNFMLLFNSTNGITRIHEVNKDGSLEKEKVYAIQYHGGWSEINLLKFGAINYIVMVKYATGDIAIRKINSDGSIDPNSNLYQTNKSWTNFGLKTIGKPYLLLVNKNENLAALYRINSDGSLGPRTDEIEFNYDTIEIVGEHLFCYNSIDGKVRKAEISNEGKLSVYNGIDTRLDTNWSTLKYITSFDNYYQRSFKNILALNKNNGQLNLYQVDNFYTSKNWICYNSSKLNANLPLGYNTVTPYDVFDGNRYQNYVMLSNSSTGEAILYNLNNNM